MKKTKYTVYIEICENVVCDMEITKKQYMEYYKQLEKNIMNANKHEYPTELVSNERTEHETYIIHERMYNIGYSHTAITKIEAKPGYCFKTK